jgi:hypothetical protein
MATPTYCVSASTGASVSRRVLAQVMPPRETLGMRWPGHAVSPSSASWVGLGENGSLVGIPAWTLHGEDLPAVQTDDQAVWRRRRSWPSEEMAKRLLDRRRQAGLAAAAHDRLLTYPDAGHLIRLGCWPTTMTHAGSIAPGGTSAGLAAAQADLKPRIISLVTS